MFEYFRRIDVYIARVYLVHVGIWGHAYGQVDEEVRDGHSFASLQHDGVLAVNFPKPFARTVPLLRKRDVPLTVPSLQNVFLSLFLNLISCPVVERT